MALVARESLEAVGLVGWPKTSGSRGIHINVRIEPRWTFPEVRRAALALARDVERRAPDLATSKWWKEERHGVFLDYNQNAKDRTVASAYSVRPLPDARVSTPLTWDEVPTVEAEAFTIDTVPARYAAIGDPGAGIDDAVGSLEALLELSARDEAEGLGDAPWPPNYAKQAGEPPRVQPSKARRPTSEYEPGRGEAGGPPPEVAAERAAAVAAGDPNAGLPTEWVGSKPTPTGRRKTSIPVVEISRAEFKEEALAGLERWKARHPEVVPYLEPADILVDGMRGRSARLVSRPGQPDPRPGGERPGQEPLESDFDPWAGMDIEAWKAATAGSRARRPTPKSRRRPNRRRRRPRTRRSRQRPEVPERSAEARSRLIEIVGIDHVQLSMPPGGEDEARRFYGDPRARGRIYQNMAAFLTRYDLLLCPAACTPPFDVNRRYVEEVAGHRFENYVDWLRLVSAITLTSCPALSLPCGFTAAGLPVGLQLVGRPRGEAVLLSAAAALEEALGIAAKTPILPLIRTEPLRA